MGSGHIVLVKDDDTGRLVLESRPLVCTTIQSPITDGAVIAFAFGQRDARPRCHQRRSSSPPGPRSSARGCRTSGHRSHLCPIRRNDMRRGGGLRQLIHVQYVERLRIDHQHRVGQLHPLCRAFDDGHRTPCSVQPTGRVWLFRINAVRRIVRCLKFTSRWALRRPAATSLSDLAGVAIHRGNEARPGEGDAAARAGC